MRVLSNDGMGKYTGAHVVYPSLVEQHGAGLERRETGGDIVDQEHAPFFARLEKCSIAGEFVGAL